MHPWVFILALMTSLPVWGTPLSIPPQTPHLKAEVRAGEETRHYVGLCPLLSYTQTRAGAVRLGSRWPNVGIQLSVRTRWNSRWQTRPWVSFDYVELSDRTGTGSVEEASQVRWGLGVTSSWLASEFLSVYGGASLMRTLVVTAATSPSVARLTGIPLPQVGVGAQLQLFHLEEWLIAWDASGSLRLSGSGDGVAMQTGFTGRTGFVFQTDREDNPLYFALGFEYRTESNSFSNQTSWELGLRGGVDISI